MSTDPGAIVATFVVSLLFMTWGLLIFVFRRKLIVSILRQENAVFRGRGQRFFRRWQRPSGLIFAGAVMFLVGLLILVSSIVTLATS